MKESPTIATKPNIASNLKGIARFITGEVFQRPRTLFMEVTMRCNARCDFCNYWQLPSMHELPEYRSIVEKLKPLSVIITGGEPLIRKDLPELVSGIKAAGPLVISLLTNGRLLTLKKAGILRDAGLDTISISLNHVGSAQDDERQIPGLFDHISRVLPQLPTLGFKRVNVNTVLLDNNLDEIRDIVRLAREWGVGVSFSCYSSKKSDNHEYEITDERLKKLNETVDMITSLRQQGWPIENSEWYLSRIPEFYRTGRVRGNCTAGRKTLHVTPDGYIKPCPDFPRVSHYTNYRARRPAKVTCDTCWYACRGEVEAPITPSRAAYFARLWLSKNRNEHAHLSDLKTVETADTGVAIEDA